MRINTNVMALNTMRLQSRTDSSLKTSQQRLSTGRRINSAADDAAGLAIFNRMTSQLRGSRQVDA
ncbi:MAG: hypothetical protein ACE5EH_05265 [Gammaproteobacteria bacterium]